MREVRMRAASKVHRPSRDGVLDVMVELGLFSCPVADLPYGIQWPMQYAASLGARLGVKLTEEHIEVRPLVLVVEQD